MRISVVTVCYNAAETIGDTLRSVAEQTYPDVEHIIVDGASKDRTLEVVHRYSHRMTVVSEPDKGLYDAMNKGWRMATGDIVGWLNADDMLADPEALGRIAAAFTPERPIVAGSIDMVDAVHTDRVRRRYSADGFDPSWLKYGYAPPHPGFYIQRSLLERIGGYDLRYPLAADFDLIARAIHRENIPFTTLPDVVVKMRVGGLSGSFRSRMRMWNETLDSCRRNGVPTNRGLMMLKFARKAFQYVT